MRQRVEDLGRLLVMIDNILEDSLFENNLNKHNFCEYFLPREVLDKEEEYDEYFDRLHKLRIGIEETKSKIYDCLSIAKGDDYLNSTDGM